MEVGYLDESARNLSVKSTNRSIFLRDQVCDRDTHVIVYLYVEGKKAYPRIRRRGNLPSGMRGAIQRWSEHQTNEVEVKARER